jgi:membrane fusion protein, macrolide-specific efflux system
MKKWIKWVVLAALLIVAGGYWAWRSMPAEQKAPTTVAVTRGDIERTVLATGVIQASSLVSVGAEVSGPIKALNVTLGDNVKAGDVIAQIDSLNQENAVKSAEAALASVNAQKSQQEATLAQAKVAMDRADKLRLQNLISDVDYQTAQLAVTTAEAQQQVLAAQIQQAELTVDSAKLNLSRTTVTSPIDGTVVSVEVEVGQTVNASNSSPTIVKIANLDNMVVKAEISEADVPKVEAGQQVYFTILGDPDTRINATLSGIEPAPESISNETTTSSSNIAVYYNGLFSVPNPDHKLRISMTAQVTIVLDEAKGVLTLPASALGRKARDGGYELEVWDAASKTTSPRKVEIGLNNNVTAEVTSGLSEGDRVVTTQAGASGASAGTGSNGGNRRSGTLLGGGGGPPF